MVEQRPPARLIARPLEQLRQRRHRRDMAGGDVDHPPQLGGGAAQIAGAHQQVAQAHAVGDALLRIGLGGGRAAP